MKKLRNRRSSSRAGQVHTAIWDFATQSVVQTIDGIGSGDLVVYDPTVDRYFYGSTTAAEIRAYFWKRSAT